MNDKKVIIYVKERNSKDKPSEDETRLLIKRAKEVFPKETLTINIESKSNFTDTLTYEEIAKGKCKALYIYSMASLLGDFSPTVKILNLLKKQGADLYSYMDALAYAEPFSDKALEIMKMFEKMLIDGLTKKMKDERMSVEDIIYEFIENGLFALDIKKEVSDIKEEIIYEELTHYFDEGFLKDIEKRMKEPEITIEEVIKELEENVRRKD